MPKETEQPPQPNGFDFTDSEKLWDQISDKRLRQWLEDEQTTVHAVGVNSNNYGEYLFLTASRPTMTDREVVTFWGLGFHELREQWIADTWRWYSTQLTREQQDSKNMLTRDKVEDVLTERLNDISAYITNDSPSERANLFSLLADLTDEDGASSELDDLGDFFNLFDD